MVSKRTGTARWGFVLIALMFSLALVACGGNAQPTVEVAPEEAGAEADVTEEAAQPAEVTDEPEPVETEEETVEPVETEEPGEDTEVFSFEGLSDEGLDSYTATLVMDFEGTDESGEPVAGSLTMAITAQRDPLAMVYEYESSDLGDLGLEESDVDPSMMGSLKFYITAEQTAMDMGGMCFAFPAEEGVDAAEEFGGMMLDPEEFTRPGDAAPELRLVGQEMVNGQQTKHYHGESQSLDEIDNATLDIWVATDGGYVARMEVSGVTTDSEFEYGDGTVHMVYDVTSVNQPVTVTLPENCQSFTMPEMPSDEG